MKIVILLIQHLLGALRPEVLECRVAGGLRLRLSEWYVLRCCLNVGRVWQARISEWH